MSVQVARRLPVVEGEELVDALDRAVEDSEGWVMAVGAVEAVELRVAGKGDEPVRKLRGRFSLVSLSGPAGGTYLVSLARASDSGIELVGGALLRARAKAVSAVLLPADIEAAAEAPPPAEARPSRPPPEPVSRWAAIAAATAEAEQEEDDDEPKHRPTAGDLVHHFAFGVCDVLMSSGDSLKIRDVKGPARIREIRLDVLTVLAPTEQDGKRLFKLVRKR